MTHPIILADAERIASRVDLSPLRGKSVMVTGESGLIGTTLCAALERSEIDRLGRSWWPREREKYDYVIHAAGYSAPSKFMADPIKTVQVATEGLNDLFRHFLKPGGTLLFLSSSEIYSGANPPHKESDIGTATPEHPRACYDDKTEILTEQGWVRFPDLREDVAVATRNPDGVLEYHVPDELIAQPYVGEMRHFSNPKFDFLVTPNHRMYVRGHRRNHPWRFVQADDNRYWRDLRVPTGIKIDAPDIAIMDLGPRPKNAKVHYLGAKMDDWLEFLGYFLSEGSLWYRARNRVVNGREYETRDYRVTISQEKSHGRIKIAECLSRLGFQFFSTPIGFVFSSKQITEMFMPLGKSGDKYIPREYMRLSVRQSRILLDALILGDGSRRGTRAVYYTKSSKLADDVQELALRCGYAATKVRRQDGQNWVVNIRTAADAKLAPPSIEHYVGTVYCVNVRNHVICVRRSGRAAWCGNSYIFGKLAGETICHIYRSQGVNAKIARVCLCYGPGTKKGDARALNQFIEQALTRGAVTLSDTGRAKRAYCYVTDTVEMLLNILLRGIQPVYNVGNPEHVVEIRELAALIAGWTGAKPNRAVTEEVGDGPAAVCLDIDRYRLEFGSPAFVTLTDGLLRTIEWQRSLYEVS